MFANSSIIQHNQEAKDKRRGRKVLPRIYVLQIVQNNQYQGLKTRIKGGCITQIRKRNTLKNLYTANQKELIIYKTKHRQRGRKNDYKIKKNHPELPKEVMSMYDLGFLGVGKDYPMQKSSLPIKKEKGCELTVQEKEYNRNHSAKRIVIKHVICRIKKVQNNERCI